MSTEFYTDDVSYIPTGNVKEKRIAVVVSEWNEAITGALCEGAVNRLIAHGVPQTHIDRYDVPGSFELIFAAGNLVKRNTYDAIIVLGCVIRGETPHFDYVCQGVTQGIAELNAQGTTPVIFGLLTTDNLEQAESRAGGKLGNKGTECATDAIKMIDFVCSFQK
ncbi:MAG: 6,7-dimethyl-8-ribityllumazine synthase [Mediterranea sp.]|jgi:6,7-dimethyl-8-ribityllumazine synthase|nr:6,7-dimethyl-8-ribityllumazine synthase [Mediterranea sp.]